MKPFKEMILNGKMEYSTLSVEEKKILADSMKVHHKQNVKSKATLSHLKVMTITKRINLVIKEVNKISCTFSSYEFNFCSSMIWRS